MLYGGSLLWQAGRFGMRSAFALRIISGIVILNFAFVALCGALQTHFHGRGRSGKRQLQRRFLRKRGAVGRSAFSVGQNAIACYLWALSTRNPFRENPPVFLHCKLQWFYAEHTQHNIGVQRCKTKKPSLLHFCINDGFVLERPTRLELATSTLARWRSTR